MTVTTEGFQTWEEFLKKLACHFIDIDVDKGISETMVRSFVDHIVWGNTAVVCVLSTNRL